MSTKLTWVQGPLVGERRSSLEITEEYARADPVYVAKTLVCRASDMIVQLAHVLCRRYLEFTLTIAQSRVMAIVDGEVCLIFITAPWNLELEISL
jgi:hypothetical protein